MKLGVMTVVLGKYSLDESLKYLKGLGVQEVEIGCGGSPGTAHADARKFMKDPALIDEFMATVNKYDIGIAALAVHGNAVHPQKAIAEDDNEQFEAAVELAEKIGVKTVITFSGCPGDCENSKYPNWSIAAWPTDYQKIRDWQWNSVLIPYWKKAAAFAKSHGVRVALELHPGFLRLQSRHDAEAARRRGRHDRRESRPVASFLAGHRSCHGDTRAEGRHLSLPRQGYLHRSV
jgi:sugar phosphate isomerase/epimerase